MTDHPKNRERLSPQPQEKQPEEGQPHVPHGKPKTPKKKGESSPPRHAKAR